MLTQLRRAQEAAWYNPGRLPTAQALETCQLTMADIQDAAQRLERFAAFFRVAFPETAPAGGIVESPLRQIPAMQASLEQTYGVAIPGKLWLKLDSHLPISGSVKARGGVYEVLKVAEDIALREGILKPGDDYSIFDTPAFRKVLSSYSIAVGSTGNLGLSIGIMSARLGFRVTVHMSADARQWKKDMLRSKGVEVIEYDSDYSLAVREGREQASRDPKCYFVDDENSVTLFLGYAVAALRLKNQLAQANIPVDRDHPLVVYLPCGVGGAPGGITFGLKHVFGDAVHCILAEPTQACCMMLGMVTGKHNEISVQDIGLEGKTAADGLAVGRASGFVGRVIEPMVTGCYTLTDQRMYRLLTQLADTEALHLEPSALAGVYGPVLVCSHPAFAPLALKNATHLAWATGGSMVPEKEWEHYYQTGRRLLENAD